MSLTTLPSELVRGVVANVESQSALCNLARCSRQLYFCTTPQIYRQVTIQEEIRQAEQQNGKLRNLASLLIRRPDLAGHVRQFTLSLLPSEMRAEYSFERIEDPDESGEHGGSKKFKVDQPFKTAISALNLSEEEEDSWLSEFSYTHDCHHDLILALLLPTLIKMEKLVLDGEIGFDTYLEWMIRRAARRERPVDTQPPFEALTVFVHSHNMSNNVQSTGFIASLLMLPAIQEISGSFGNISKLQDANEHLIKLDNSSSPLISLNLTPYLLNAADLGHVLRAPKALKTLFFKLCPPACINLTHIRHALRPQESSLENLSLAYDEDCESMFRKPSVGSMPSFISFNALKLFKTNAFFLRSTDNGIGLHQLINIFPPNLETLHLTCYGAFCGPLLVANEYLLGQKSPQQIPSLKYLIIEGIKFFNGWPLWTNARETAMERLSKVAAAQGVSVEITEDSTFGFD